MSQARCAHKFLCHNTYHRKLSKTLLNANCISIILTICDLKSIRVWGPSFSLPPLQGRVLLRLPKPQRHVGGGQTGRSRFWGQVWVRVLSGPRPRHPHDSPVCNCCISFWACMTWFQARITISEYIRIYFKRVWDGFFRCKYKSPRAYSTISSIIDRLQSMQWISSAFATSALSLSLRAWHATVYPAPEGTHGQTWA